MQLNNYNFELEKINDIYSNMYLGEIQTLNDSEFKLLAYLRIRAGDKMITWHQKSTLQEEVGFGKDKLNNTLNSLEAKGAIIVFNCKDTRTSQQVSNIYYVCEYDKVNKEYMTANSIERIMQYALNKRENEEFSRCFKNNSTPRTFKIETRLTLEERKIKFYKKPSADFQYMDKNSKKPSAESPTMDSPTTGNQYSLNNKSFNKQLNSNKQLNNNKKKNVVVTDSDFKTIENLTKDISNLSKEDIEIIYNDIVKVEGNLNIEILKIRIATVKKYMKKNKVDNITGLIRVAIKQKWELKGSKVISSFNNYDQRTYDFETLERKLLGWDSINDEE